MESQVNSLQEQIDSLTQENYDLKTQLQQNHSNNKRKEEKLRDEYYKLEASLEILNLRNENLEQTLRDAQLRMVSAEKNAAEFDRLRDELDEGREAMIKVSQYENEIRNYKKKLEKVNMAKESVNELELKNQELEKANKILEDAANKTKSQMDSIKKNWSVSQDELFQERMRALTAEENSKSLRERLKSAESTISKLKAEKELLEIQFENITDSRSIGFRQGSLKKEIEFNEVPQSLTLESDGEDWHIESGPQSMDSSHYHLTPAVEPEKSKDMPEINLVKTEPEGLQKTEEASTETLNKETAIVPKIVQEAPDKIEEYVKALAILKRENELMASAHYNLSRNLYKNCTEVRNLTFLEKLRNPVRS